MRDIERQKAYAKAWREAHKEELREKNKKYRMEHKAEIAARDKRYQQEHREQLREGARKRQEKYRNSQKGKTAREKYNIENAEKIKESCKRYYYSHQERIKIYRNLRKDISKEYQVEYQKKNRERINQLSKEWCAKNKEKRAAISKKYNETHITKKRGLQHYCCEDVSCIENYSEAMKDNLHGWDIHHKLETRGFGYTWKELIMLGLYYDRPANELIFLKHDEHLNLHKTFRASLKKALVLANYPEYNFREIL